MNNLNDLILYQSENIKKTIEVLYDDEDFLVNPKNYGEFFNVAKNNITYHLQNIFNSG